MTKVGPSVSFTTRHRTSFTGQEVAQPPSPSTGYTQSDSFVRGAEYRVADASRLLGSPGFAGHPPTHMGGQSQNRSLPVQSPLSQFGDNGLSVGSGWSGHHATIGMQGQTPQYSAMGGQLRAQAFGETGVGAQVRHDFGFQGNTVYGDVGAGAGVYAQGGGHAALGGRNLGVEGTVQGINGSTAQAGAQAQAGLGPDGITLHGSASGSALLGATVSGDAVFRSRYLDIGGGAGLTAGLAAKGEVGGGINNGTLGLNARLGGALGIGGEVGFEAGIHVGRIYGDIGYAAGVVRDTIGPEPITIEELDRRFPDGFIQP